jgi:transposase
MLASRRPPGRVGQIDREQGVSKAGNPRLRAMLLQLAWLWLRHQPDSVLSQWFLDRVKANGGRLKKPTIVALARKLLVALWKYVTSGSSSRGRLSEPRDCQFRRSHQKFARVRLPGGSRWMNR